MTARPRHPDLDALTTVLAAGVRAFARRVTHKRTVPTEAPPRPTTARRADAGLTPSPGRAAQIAVPVPGPIPPTGGPGTPNPGGAR